MTGKIYYTLSSILFLIGVFIALSPVLLTPDIIYPLRLDSAYIAFHATLNDSDEAMFLTPAAAKLNYSDITVTTKDGIQLKGWFVSAPDTPANTILIIHDLNESKILYIDHLKQFHDRGFNAAVFDLRAHGTSGGNEFSPGIPAVDDVYLFTDSVLKMKGTRNLVFMGCGIGAAIALQSSVYDERCNGLVLQSPFKDYEHYLDRYSYKKWGMMKGLWYPVLKRRSELLMHYQIKQLDLSEIAKYTKEATLFIIGAHDEIVSTSESLQVFDAMATDKKELILVKDADHSNIAKNGGEVYYNRITEFLNSNLPKEQKTMHEKRLAFYRD